MAEKRTINIDINNNADEAAKDFQDFAKATNVANDSVEGLNKTFEQAYLKAQNKILELRKIEHSPEIAEIFKKVAGYYKHS